ncbi:HET-domain-containing protein [Nemania sp. FL0916]|nr:HET-domain-containing protein [Nemania sp. FL0916]
MSRCIYCAKLSISHLIELARVEFESGTVPDQAFYHHHASLYDLESSAGGGCDLCILILGTLRGVLSSDYDDKSSTYPGKWIGYDLDAEESMLEEVRDLPATNVKIFIDSEHLYTAESLDKVRVFDVLRIHVGLVSPERSFVWNCVPLVMFTSPTSECYIDGFRIGRLQTELDLASEANFDLARRWMNACQNDHTGCLKNSTPDLPTRVIDVGAKSRDQRLRLIITQGQRGSYVALSHCWGGQVSQLLLIDNIDQFKHGIEIQDLPLTFQDAVRIALELNIGYLWIDSLCIIQNSKADWEQESKKMSLYYGNSTLTIYASSSESSTSGIFPRHTPPSCVGPSPVYLDLSSGSEREQQIKVQAIDFDDEHLALLDLRGPLASRGWTLQESILAPRQLYFGKRQMYWQCLQEAQSADGLGHAAGSRTPDAAYPSLRSVLFSDALINPTKVAKATEEILVDYYRLVENYSLRELSVASDKFPAFSGIVQRIHSFIGGDYLAGLWSCDFPRGIAWYKDGRTCRHVSNYRSPSWSWAVTDEGVSVSSEQVRSDEFKLRLISHHITLGNPANPYGQVSGGYLHVRGRIRPLYRSTQSLSFGTSLEKASLGIVYYDDIAESDHHDSNDIRTLVSVRIDNEDCLVTVLKSESGEDEDLKVYSDTFLPGKYIVLIIGTYTRVNRGDDLSWASGLILQESEDKETNNFQRVGYLPRIDLDPDWLPEWEEKTLKLI